MAKAKKAANAVIDFVTPKKASGALPSAPEVMTRSQITDLANAIKNREGAYGVRRVERAADEIPNLERLYTQQALADAFSGDNARALMTMNPADFERYAAPIGDSFKLNIYQPEQGRRLQARGEGLLPPITGDEYIKHLAQIKQQGGFSDIPYLNVNKEEQGLPDYPFISGHEGRHRNRAMAASGEQAGLVQFLPRAELREPFPRRMSEQYIDAIRKEMGLSGNFVLPQKYHIPSDTSINDVVVNRPAIELPDLYAAGGLVDSAPEEAIKNTITDPQAFKMLDMDLANLALMSQQPPRRMAEGGKMSKDEDLFALKPQPKPAVPTVRELIAEIGKSPARYETKYPAKDFTPLELQAYRLMQAAKATPDANRYLESLNPYFDSQLKFDIGAGSDAGYVEPKVPNLAVVQQLQDIKNTIPHELTHTLQLGKGKGVELERDRQVMQRAQAMPIEMQKTMMPSGNRFDDMREVWANINARAHEVNAAGGDFINSPEGRALFPTPEMQREYYTKSMPGVNSMTPSTGTFVANTSAPVDRSKQSYAQQALRALGFAQGGVVHMAGGGSFNPQGADYDYQTARAYGMGQDGGNWGSVAPASEGERKLHGLPEDSYLMLKGAQHPTWGKAVEAETARGSKIVKHGDRYYSVPNKANGGQVQRFDEGGEVSQSELDRMKFEIAQAQNPTSPVMQATPRSPIQNAIGTFGGYMDKAGKFVSEAIAPTAEKHPVKHFLANMLLADSLKGAGTLMQDLTGTAREADEDNPVRGIIDKDWRKLSTSTAPLLDPRALDLAGFATPVVKGITKLGQAGAKAITPFAKTTAEMAAELYGSGKVPGMVAPNAYMAEPSAPKPEKILAPANEQGFYSPTEAAALNLQRKTGNGQAFLNDLMKGENVSSEEISGMGLDTFLKGRTSVTAAEVQDYIAKNKLGLGEQQYGDFDKIIKAEAKKYGLTVDNQTDFFSEKLNNYVEFDELPPSIQKLINNGYKETKFDQYQLPGGENYREVVLTLPIENTAALEAAQIKAGDARRQTADLSVQYRNQKEIDPQSPRVLETWQKLEESRNLRDQAEAEADKLRTITSEKTYRSSHFDEPNVLAHLRMSDRVTDGKKTLLVDEVQSDWHQAGKEKGYGPTMEKSVEAYYETKDGQRIPIGFGKTKEEAEANIDVGWKNMVDIKYETHERKIKEGVPNAPYKEDWYQLALRRAVKEAIDGGYDRVALPTGARVNERFSLTKQINEIHYSGSNLKAYDHNGKEVISQTGVRPEDLPSYVGKETANKLLEQPKQGTLRSLVGQDLEVGGEGNKKWYDEIYPGYLKKFGKKYGASVGTTYAKTDIQEWPFPIQIESDGKNFWLFGQDPRIDKKAKLSSNFSSYEDANKFRDSMYEGNTEPLHYMDITPAMRKEFSTGIHMKKGGKVSFASNIDAMRHELNKRQ
jgi:hypothetical protein